MTPRLVTLAALAGHTGAGVRVAVVDSGIHGAHPHVGGIGDAIAIDDHGVVAGDATDRLGHGTAVAAAIREKAPDCTLISVKIFDRALVATGAALDAAIRIAADRGADIINLSLGTTTADHRARLSAAIDHAADRGARVVAAAPQPGAEWLPGAIDGVWAVAVDADLPRDHCRIIARAWTRQPVPMPAPARGETVRLAASPHPRPLPGVPPDRNFRGPSFAVANATGLLAVLVGASRATSRA